MHCADVTIQGLDEHTTISKERPITGDSNSDIVVAPERVTNENTNTDIR